MKKIKIASVVMGLGIVCAFCFWKAGQQKAVSNVFLENIEALAAGEDDNTSYFCFGIGSVDCPIDHSKVEGVWSEY